MRSAEEIKKIAEDIFRLAIFTDKHIRPNELSSMLFSVFMPLVFMDEKKDPEFHTTRKGRKIRNPKHISNWHTIFEYHSASGNQSINGYPIFMSLQWLDFTDGPRMWEEYNKICLVNNKPDQAMKIDYRTAAEMRGEKPKIHESDKRKRSKNDRHAEAKKLYPVQQHIIDWENAVKDAKELTARNIDPNSKKAQHMKKHRKRDGAS